MRHGEATPLKKDVETLSQLELKKILYIEDDPDIQEVARMALEVVGNYEVGLCSSGSEALNLVEEFRPDLVLLDVMMPGMDGLSTLEALRSMPGMAKTPVIFVTAKVQANEVAQYRELGAIDVIAKPFDPMHLAEEVFRLWEKYPHAHESQGQ